MTGSSLAGADIAGILFDLDGVLWDSSTAHAMAFNETFRAYGLPLLTDYVRIAGMRTEEAIEQHLREHDLPVDAVQICSLTAAKRKASLELLYEQAALAAGVSPTLERLRAIYRIALCTSGSRQSVRCFFEKSGCEAVFHAVVNGSEVECAKPAPDIFLLGAARLGLSPDTCLVVEDSLAGVQAAVAAGMRAVGVGAAAPRLLRAGAWMTIAEVSELPALVGL